jgi:hypothetical protein
MMTLTERDNMNILDSLGLKRGVTAGPLFAAFGVDSRPDQGKGARFGEMSRAQQSGWASPNILGTVENVGGPPLRFGRRKRLGSYRRTRIRGRRAFLEGRRERTVPDDDHGEDGPSMLARIRAPR